MAKRRMRLRGLAGLGNLRTPGSTGRDVMPATLGLLISGGVTLAVRAFLKPAEMPKLYRWAPAIGAGAGLLGAVGVGAVGGAGPGIASAVASVVGGGLLLGSEALNAALPYATIAISGDADPIPSGSTDEGVAGLGALMAERNGMGAIVMQPVKGAYGETVSLAGASVNQSAFGREAFAT